MIVVFGRYLEFHRGNGTAFNLDHNGYAAVAVIDFYVLCAQNRRIEIGDHAGGNVNQFLLTVDVSNQNPGAVQIELFAEIIAGFRRGVNTDIVYVRLIFARGQRQ